MVSEGEAQQAADNQAGEADHGDHDQVAAAHWTPALAQAALASARLSSAASPRAILASR